MWSSMSWSMSSSGWVLGRAKTAKPKPRSASTQRCSVPGWGGMLANTHASTSGASGRGGAPSRSPEGSRMGVLVSQVFNGLSVGSILLLAALGLALTFGQMGVINMAHGEFIMAGAYTAYVTNQILGSAGLSLLLSLPIAFVVAGLLGVLLEATLLRRMYHRPLDTLLVTWGVSLVLQQLARDVFGTAGVDVPAPGWLSGPVEVLGFSFPRTRLFILLLAVAAFVALAAGLKFTSLGRR